MPFGFLSQIPQLVGRGLGAAAGGIKKAPGLFGQAIHQGQDEDLALTPGFNGSLPSPTFKRPQMPTGAVRIDENPRMSPGVMDRPSPLQPAPNIRPRPAEPITPMPGSPTFRPQTPQEEIDAAKATHAQNYQPPTGFGGRLKAAAPAVLRGLLAASAGGEPDAARSGAGALGGLLTGLIAPRQVAQADFEQRQLPQILARQKREQEQQVFQEARNKAALEDQYRRGQIGAMPSADEARAEREADLKYKAAQTEALGRRDNSGKDSLLNTPGGLYDIKTGQIIPGTTRPQAPQRAQRVRPGETLIDANGNVVYQSEAPEKETKTAEKRKAVGDFDALKADTDYWNQKLAVAKQSGDAAKIQEAEIEYNNAFQKENAAARLIGETYPDEYEAGPGTGGRAYVKAKPPQPRQRPKAAQGGQRKAVVDDRFVNFTAQKLGISREEARRRIEAGGYEYQPQQQ